MSGVRRGFGRGGYFTKLPRKIWRHGSGCRAPCWLRTHAGRLKRIRMIEKAKKFAEKAHKGQFYGSRSYIYHLLKVAEVAARFGFKHDVEFICGCWLHDAVEDTDVSVSDVRREFGSRVADMVKAVSDIPGKDKRHLFEKLTKNNRDAVLLKTFDRIANLEACLAEGKTKLLKKYIKEMPLFFEVLEVENVHEEAAKHLRLLENKAQRRVA